MGMRKVAFFSTLIVLLSLAPASYAHGSWGGGGWGWRGGGCCWGGRSSVFIGFGGFGYGGYGGYPYYPYAYAPSPYPAYYPYYPYPAYPGCPAGYPGAYPAAYSAANAGTVSPGTPRATNTVDPATVRAIQSELQREGYDVGVVDGRVGPRTRGAIRRYEQQNGLPVDGSPSRSLLNHMRSQSTG